MAYYIMLAIFLLLMGTQISVGFAFRGSRADVPPIYYDDSFSGLMKALLLPVLVLFVILMVMNWKITLIATAVGGIFGSVLKRISEVLIIVPLYRLFFRRRD